MAYVAPTPDSLKARYPEFGDLTDQRIQVVLDEVVLDVTDDWPDDYRAPAMMAMAGHLLASEGALTNDQTVGGTITSQVIEATLNDASVKFSDPNRAKQTTVTTSKLDATAYGRRFQDLKKLAFPVYTTIVRA